MTCEEVSAGLIAYLDHRVISAERREMEDHLASCAACQMRAGEFRKVFTVLDELPLLEPSFGFDVRVRERIAAEPRRRWFPAFLPQPRLAFSAALLLAMAIFVAKLPLSNRAAPPAASPVQQGDFNAIQNLGVLENYDIVTNIDALSELAPAASPDAAQPEQPATHDDGGI